MDIGNMTNINGRYVLNSQQHHKMKENGITNPFTANISNSSYGLEPVYVLKKQDFAVNHHNHLIEGEGGAGSGEPLLKRFGKNAEDPEMKKRRASQIKNAQRKYRAEHRTDYNEYMRDLYHKMAKEKKFVAGEPSARYGINEKTGGKHSYAEDTTNTNLWYEERLKKARIANKEYRKKIKAERVIANLDKIIQKELKKKFKEEFKRTKRGRPSKTDTKEIFNPDSEWYKSNYEKLKKAKQEEVSELGKVNRNIQLKETPEYPLGAYKTFKTDETINKFEPNKLVTEYNDFTPKQIEEYNKNPAEFNKKMQQKRKEKKEAEKKKENIVMTIQEKESPFTPTEPSTKKKKEILFKNKTYEDLTNAEKMAYDYITEKNKGQTMTIPYSKIPDLVKIRFSNVV